MVLQSNDKDCKNTLKTRRKNFLRFKKRGELKKYIVVAKRLYRIPQKTLKKLKKLKKFKKV